MQVSVVRSRGRWHLVIRVVAVALGLAIFLYGAWLVLFGIPFHSAAILPPGETPTGAEMGEYARRPEGTIPLLAAFLLVVGVVVDQPLAFWAGWAALAVFGVLFVFSTGGLLIPPTLVLLIALILLTLNKYWLAAEGPGPN